MYAAMTTPTSSSDDGRVNTAVEGARGITVRLFAWVVGGILAGVGAVTTVYDLWHHYHGIGPYLLAGAFLLMFLASYDMWRDERTRGRRRTRLIRRLASQVDRQDDHNQHIEHDRDEWRRMHAEEASVSRRLFEELGRIQQQLQQPQISGGTAGVASTGPARQPIFNPPGPPPTPRPPPRHSRRRPPKNQPPLFDQDESEG